MKYLNLILFAVLLTRLSCNDESELKTDVLVEHSKNYLHDTKDFCPVPSFMEFLLGKTDLISETDHSDAESETSEKEIPEPINYFKKRNLIGLKKILIRYFIVPIRRTLAFLFEEVDQDTHFVMKKGIKESEKTEKTYKCLPTNHSSATVNFIPEGDLVTEMNHTTARCGLVLFYTPYCRFSIEMLPAYKALARIFPSLEMFAVKINSYSSSSIQFGAVGTPTVMFFHNSRPVRKLMPSPLNNITVMAEHVVNITDLEPIEKIEILECDHEGVELMHSFDWVLLFSVVFLAGSACYNFFNTEVGKKFVGKFIKVNGD